MIKYPFLLLLLFAGLTGSSQNVGIGTTAPNASALLELQSTNKGLLLPRVADTNAITSPARGLVIYSTTANALFYHNGSYWQNTANNESTGLWYKRQDSLLYTNLKYVTINPNNESRQPMEGLSVNGNFLVQRNFRTSTKAITASQIYTMNNSGTQQYIADADSAGKILDPGGQNANYSNGMQGTVIMSPGDQHGATFSFNRDDFGLAAGDTLWIGYNIFPFCRTDFELMLTNTSTVPADFSLRSRDGFGYVTSIVFEFRSNSDGINNKGFDITWKKNYSSIPAGSSSPESLGTSMFFNTNDGSFQAGAPLQNIGRSAICIGCKNAQGTRSLAMAEGTAKGISSAALLGGLANGTGSIAMGYQSTSEGSNSISLGGTALSFRSTSIGSANDTLTGTSKDSWVNTDPLVYIGNGRNSSTPSNAMVIYKNANVDINGYTRLGKLSEGAPEVKMKKIIIPVGPAVDGLATFSFGSGITDDKVLGVDVLMKYDNAGPSKIPPSYRDAPGYEYNIQVQFNGITVINKPGNSTNIGGKQITILVTYEE